MKNEIIKIIGFNIEPERANIMAQQILDLFILPTSEELQEIVEKIAYSQQGEDQAEDCYSKMGILNEFISKYINNKF